MLMAALLSRHWSESALVFQQEKAALKAFSRLYTQELAPGAGEYFTSLEPENERG